MAEPVEPPRRPRGRPRVPDADRRVNLCVGVPGRDYDRLCKRALAQGESVAQVAREILLRHTRKPSP